MDVDGFDEADPEQIIEMLKGLTKIIKEENEKKEKLRIECKKMWYSQ